MSVGLIALDQGDPWFWIITGVGTVAVGAALRWVWMAVLAQLREVFKEPAKATERAGVAAAAATDAATHTQALTETIGQKNRQGDLMTIATKILLQQNDMRVGLDQASESLADTARWQVTHDEKDIETRVIVDATMADVTAIKDHLGM